jgi:peroxiredoxin
MTHRKVHALHPGLLLISFLLCWASISQSMAQEFIWAPQLAVGSQLPPIDAADQHGQRQDFADLSGENGLVLIMSRSFDWCPYCIRQLQQLVDAKAQFAALGFNVATMTYDPVPTLQEAAAEYDTDFPLLYDENNAHVKAMGILNTEYEPGHRAYGIPYPGIFILDAQGTIRAKLAEEDYRVRPDLSLVLETLAKL